MPNLVGYWSPDASEGAVRDAIAKQLQRVRIEGVAYAEHSEIAPGFGIALQDHGILDNGTQPVHSDDGRVSLMLDGEILDTAALARRFRGDLPDKPMRAAELCLRLIVKHGPDIVDQFNGLFAIAVYDRRERRLTLVSDHFAFRPVFYVQRAKAFVFGSELKALSAVDPEPRKLDDVAIFERFCYGAHVANRTWMQGYLRLAPATILTVDPGGVKTRAYWRYQYDEGAPILDQSTYVANFAVLLDRAAERCMQGARRKGIFLSGGYDSRSVAASIRSDHLPIPAFTFGYPESRDVRFAAMLAERLGLSHHPVSTEAPYLFPNCASIVWRTEGLISFAHATSIQHHSFFKEKGVEIVLLGLLGEFNGSHTWPKLLTVRSRRDASDAILERQIGGRLGLARRIFKPAFFQAALEGLKARFRESFEAIANEHPLNIADCWSFNNLQTMSSWSAPSVDRHRFEIRLPLMDMELVRFLLTIPPYSRLEQRIYKKMIAYTFPKIRDVPCTNSGLPINPHFVREYASMVARYLGRKALRPLNTILGRGASLGREFRDLGDAFRKEPALIEKILKPLIDDGVFADTLFDRKGIEAIVDEHYRRGARHQDALSLMISFGLAARFFLHDDFSLVPPQLHKP